MHDGHQRRRPPEHDKFSSPEYDRQQQRQRTGHPADDLPARLRDRIKWDDDDAPQQHPDRRPAREESREQQQRHPSPQRRQSDSSRQRSSTQDNSEQPQQPQLQRISSAGGGGSGGGGGNGSGGGSRARIEFNLDKLQAPAGQEDIKPRLSSKYSKDMGSTDPPILRRLSGSLSDKQPDAPAPPAEPADRDTQRQQAHKEQQQQKQQRQPRGSEQSEKRPRSPDRGPPGRLHERERERERDRDRERPRESDRERDHGRERGQSQRRAAAADRPPDSSRERQRPRSHDSDKPRSRDVSRDVSRDGRRQRSRERSRERVLTTSSRERSRERVVSSSRERSSRDHPSREPPAKDLPHRSASHRDTAGRPPSRDASHPRGPPAAAATAARDDTREGQRPAPARAARDDGFARPQPRPPPPPPKRQQQLQPRPVLQNVSWADAEQAERLLAGVRARHAGLVEQQLSHLILTKALAREDVWEQVCKAANIPPELLDGPLVSMARRSDIDHALMSRASAHIMPPLDPDAPTALAGVGEDVYIQQLQAVINRYEQQSAAPYCAEVWALRSAAEVAQRGGGGGGQLPEGQEGVSYPLLLPAELRGLMWDA